MGWAEALTAVSTAAIALAIIVGCIAVVFLLKDARRLIGELESLTKKIDEEGKPAIESFRTMIADASTVVTKVKTEVDGLADTSRVIRKRAERAAASIDDRLHDIEALVDVVQQEVEDVALDITAALRTTRRGGKLFKRMRRALLRRGRRR
jgi:methyl-accepting chemotaxis protein